MEMVFDEWTDGELIAVIDTALTWLTDERVRLTPDIERLALLVDSLKVDARLRAWQAWLAAQVDTAEVAWHEHGTSTSTWLADVANLTRREAAHLITNGHEQTRFAVVGAAACAGNVLPGQAEAITSVLADLPDDFPTQVVEEGQALMVGFAATHNAVELRRLSSHLLDVLDPAGAEAKEARRLERDHRSALRNRHLNFVLDHHGSLLIRGSLPVADAEPFVRIIDSYTAAARRGVDRLDPQAEYVTPAMGRADALVTMCHHHTQQALAPSHGGDRPRIVVTMSYDKLLKMATDAGMPLGGLADTEQPLPRSTENSDGRLPTGRLTGTGQPIPASVLRRWLCDADLLPAVLGGSSEILDVGRTQRLVTGPIRAALDVRDGGCVFPGCDRPPQDCHAHHLQPWWAGGATALGNLVLLCPHHHGIIEPGHDPTTDRWQLRLRPDGVPEVLPPARVDIHQRPRLHARFQTPQRS